MAGDLEDFLRRAAQRRQQKAAQQKQQASTPPREPPQYSDSRRERVTGAREPEQPIVVADIVESAPSRSAETLRQSQEATRKPAKRARRRAQSKTKASVAGRSVAQARDTTSSDAASTGNPAVDLINMLKRPGGVQQAILLREIFDRPEHRW